MPERLLFLSLLVLLALAAPSEARSQDAVVLASTAPGIAPGKLVSDGARVSVPEGASATLLLATGRSIALRGPFEGSLADAAPAAPAAPLGPLWNGNTLSQTELGASRAFEDTAAGPVPAIDPSRPGRQCIAGSDPPRLSRPADPRLAPLSLNDPKTGITAVLDWPSAGTIAWPSAMPAEDGAKLLVLDKSGKPRHEIEVRRIEAAATTAVGLAVALASAGCEHQAAALLAPLRDATVPLDLYLATDRGPFPTYRPGERTQIVLETNRDAHLYCYLRTAQGEMIPIFPSSRSSGSDVKANMPVVFPGERMPLPLRAENQEVLCHATDRDRTADLSGRGSDFQPLKGEALAELDRALGTLDGPGSVSARVVLRAE